MIKSLKKGFDLYIIQVGRTKALSGLTLKGVSNYDKEIIIDFIGVYYAFHYGACRSGR